MAAGGPYDRLIATFSVTQIPPAWVEQTRPGGRLVVPLHRDIWAGGLATLDVDPGGQAAHGRLAGEAWFMPARGQRLPGTAVDSATGRASTTALSAARIVAPGFGAFAHARLPHITMVRAAEGCGWRVWLTGRDGSAATAWGDDEDGQEFQVWQYGPADLWRQVETAWQEYTALGAPDAGAFGLTATRDGRQWIWLGEPGLTVGRPASETA